MTDDVQDAEVETAGLPEKKENGNEERNVQDTGVEPLSSIGRKRTGMKR
jgi:hypothetical protein